MFTTIDENIIIRAFLDSLSLNEIVPYDETFQPELDGELHRFRTQEDPTGATSGAYLVFSDRWPHWYIQDHRKQSDMIHVILDKENLPREERIAYAKRYSVPERTAAAVEAEKQKLLHQKEKQLRDSEAEKNAVLNAWREYQYPCACEFGPLHPYLRSKHIDNSDSVFFGVCHILKTKATYSAGDICQKGELLIPLIHADTFEFSGLVRIFSRPNSEGKFSKHFYTGTHSRGCCCPLIPYRAMNFIDPVPTPLREVKPYRSQKRTAFLEADMAFIAEGIGAAFAVLELSATKYPVLAAMSCHNIIHVAQAWRNRYPRLKILIAADNDKPGIEAAQQTLNAGYADKMIIPPIAGQDWNDYLSSQKGTH